MPPIITQKEPFLCELGGGEYWWCACGASDQQPWCDHRAGDDCRPLKLNIAPRRTPQTVWLCGCRHSKRLPFCDGSHNKLPP